MGEGAGAAGTEAASAATLDEVASGGDEALEVGLRGDLEEEGVGKAASISSKVFFLFCDAKAAAPSLVLLGPDVGVEGGEPATEPLELRSVALPVATEALEAEEKSVEARRGEGEEAPMEREAGEACVLPLPLVRGRVAGEDMLALLVRC